MHYPKRQSKTRGSALISALFIMTLVAIAATAMTARMQFDIYRTRMTILSDRLYLASQQITFWAMSELKKPKNHFTVSDEQGKVLTFPDKLRESYPGLMIQGDLYDLQSRFNLNNLTNRNWGPPFLKLLENTKIKIPPQTRMTILEALVRWISPWQPGRGTDDLLHFYLKQNPPYLPGFQAFYSPSEFRLIRGVNSAIYENLAKLITTLPETTPININTASKEILQILGNGLGAAEVNELIEARGELGITELGKIDKLLKKLAIRREQITLESHYFMSVATISHQDLKLTVFSIFKRSLENRANVKVSLVGESLNAL